MLWNRYHNSPTTKQNTSVGPSVVTGDCGQKGPVPNPVPEHSIGVGFLFIFPVFEFGSLMLRKTYNGDVQ